jgi:hypothetical protein
MNRIPKMYGFLDENSKGWYNKKGGVTYEIRSTHYAFKWDKNIAQGYFPGNAKKDSFFQNPCDGALPQSPCDTGDFFMLITSISMPSSRM